MSTKKDVLSAKKLLGIFLPKLWLIVAVAVICGLVFGVYSYTREDVYSSTGKYMVRKVPYENDDSGTTGLNQNEIIAMQGMIANAKEIINTGNFCEEVSDRVSRQTKVNVSADRLMSSMSVSLCNDETTCYYFKVTSTNKQLAADIARVAGSLLSDMFKDMGYAIAVDEIDSPQPADAPDGKNVTRNAIIGALIGAFLSAMIIFIISKFDVVIRSKEKLEGAFDYPILGVIPRPESNK